MLDIVGMTDDTIGASDFEATVVLAVAGARPDEQHSAQGSDDQKSCCRSFRKEHEVFLKLAAPVEAG